MYVSHTSERESLYYLSPPFSLLILKILYIIVLINKIFHDSYEKLKDIQKYQNYNDICFSEVTIKLRLN